MFSGGTSAAIVVLELTGVVAAPVPAELSDFSVGDSYTLTVTIDDAVTDVGAGTSGGSFPGLVTAFNAQADPGNTGSWTPDGTLDGPGSNYVTNANGNNFTLQLRGNGFDDGGDPTFSFFDFSIGLNWPPGITDSGAGDTFAQQLGQVVAIPPAEPFVEIRFRNGVGDFVVIALDIEPASASDTVAPVPVPADMPAAILLMLLGLGLLGCRRLAR